MKKLLPLACAAFVSNACISNALAVTVHTELVLLADVSGSVNQIEYDLQKTGYVNAFQSSEVVSAIASVGSIAVTYVEWSGKNQQAQLVNWSMISNAQEASNFASAINNTSRSFYNMTAPGSAITYATNLFGTETGGSSNGFESNFQIIDISGDGLKNNGQNVGSATSNALSQGVDKINGLPIGNATIANYYGDQIVAGEGAFYMSAYQFADIEDSLVKKLAGEITGTTPEGANTPTPAAAPPADVAAVPVPAAAWLFGSAMTGLALVGRRRNTHKSES
ncbi:DUF1194 domain-containing protein [Oceanicoccus sagamiensis]|uniref:VWFA domain-containing protein n=1 Tax=Oceanicoccus sagamiensis TaxID=716816 RepID=A0A1X9N7Q5_9GAMM|nr:DUF1194 domain-containing protein [Oceanicoccus sagamiensis]ARN73211.1 hypothetical protein BST96_03270 [Oceanicoccus sagamiensis]